MSALAPGVVYLSAASLRPTQLEIAATVINAGASGISHFTIAGSSERRWRVGRKREKSAPAAKRVSGPWGVAGPRTCPGGSWEVKRGARKRGGTVRVGGGR